MSRFVLTAQLQLQAPNNVSQVVSQIQSQLNNLSVNVQVQGSARANQQIQQITQSTQAATTAAGRMGNAFAVSIRRFAAFSIATRAVGLFTSTLADAVKTAIDFEREVIKISQVTGRSVSSLRDLTDSVTNLSTGLGVTSQSLLEVTTVLTQAGLSSEDTKIALESLARAALAPNFDSITETAEGAIAILAQFKQGVGALEGQLSSIDAVAGAFAVEASDLIDVIRRSGGVFKASGGSLNELLALFTSVRATTRESAESIGTGLRTIFTRIQRPETIEFLRQFGVELVDLNGKFVGPFEAIRKLSEALSGLGEGDLTFISIAEELGGFRQIGKVLPLLQQFSTAQAALNVAQNAGNGLTKNAEIAQASLAIRILKVREEFLALVRSMTETPTFQIMANTALSLASALIKIADSIKPLLPLLGAVAAFKAVKGIGGFLGGIGSGLTSGRTFSSGGRVHAFATGGLVPGTGNSDTVPAMLTPGEFVIRKSSVQKLGASNLAQMNTGGTVQKFAAGGMVNKNRGFYGNIGPDGRSLVGKTRGLTLEEAIKSGFKRSQLSSAFGVDAVNSATGTTAAQAQAKLSKDRPKGKEGSKGQVKNITLSQPFGVSFLKGFGSNVDMSSTINDVFKYGNASGTKVLREAILKSTGKKSISEAVPAGAKISATQATTTFLDPKGSKIFEDDITSILPQAFDKAAKSFNGELNASSPPKTINQLLSKSAINSIEGQFFEAFVRSVTGNVIADDGKSDAIFDFTSINGPQANKLFGVNEFILPNEFKNEPNRRNIASSIAKGLSLGAGATRIQKFAVGGRAKGIQGAPLVDDILQTSGSILPRPTKAIQDLIKAGGGAVDVDRTLLRTIGDKAYGKAPTSGAKDAALNKYFRDQKNRLQDLKTAPITQFGKELQVAIKSGKLDARKISIASKSQNVRGAREYLSQLFGIPTQNIAFTQGGDKGPFLDAVRKKGSRVDRVARFATGGGVGTDTVPALLTPGEFVVNKSSAQRIGYGNLNRMNKVGKYAKGGVVQTFANGGTATGGTKSVISNIPVPGFDTKAPTLLNKIVAQLTGTFTVADLDFKQASQKFQLLKSVAPDLARSLQNYAKTSNLNNQEAAQLVSAYSKLVDTMLLQGNTDMQIVASMQPYLEALEADTKAKLNAAKATAAASAATNPGSSASISPVVSKAPTPMGAPGSIPGMNNNTTAIVANTQAQQQAASTAATVANNNKMFAASMAVSLLQGFLPAIDENSSTVMKLTSGFVGFIGSLTTVGFALEAFGVKLSLAELGSIDKLSNRLGLVFDSVAKAGQGLYTSIISLISGKAAENAATVASTSATAASTAATSASTVATGASTVANTASAAASSAAATADFVEADASLAAAAANTAESASSLGKSLGAFAIGLAAAYLVVKTFSSLQRQSLEAEKKKAVDKGDVTAAGDAGAKMAGLDFIENMETVGTVVGAIGGAVVGGIAGGTAGSVIPFAGTAAGAAVGTAAGAAAGGIVGGGAGRMIGNALVDQDTINAGRSEAQAAAQFVKTAKLLDNSAAKTKDAMDSLAAGTISVRDALSQLTPETQSAVDALKINKQANADAEKSAMNSGFGGSVREFGAYATFGYVDSNKERGDKIRSGNEARSAESQKLAKQQLANIQPMLNQQMNDIAAGGGSFDDFISSLSDAEFELLNLTDGAMRGAASSFENISREIERAQKAFAAMNLGMQNVQGAASAAALGVSNYVASQQAGNIGLEQSLAVLEASVTSAAQGISNADFNKAFADVESTLRGFGANDEQISKLKNNLGSVNEVQKNQSAIFGGAKDKLAENIRNSSGAKGRQEAFTQAIDEQLKAAGYDEQTRQRFKDASANMSDEQLKEIGKGNFTAFEESINELGKKTMEQINGPIKAAIEIQKQLNDLTKQRIEAERQLMNAQLEASNVRMEAMDIAAKYGGPKVTPQMRAQNVVQQANIRSSGIQGVTDLKTGSAAELATRTQQLSQRQSEISEIRMRAATGDSAAKQQLEGASGLKLQEEEKKLQEAANSQIQATRDLIKSKEEELKLIKEKNQLEKSSIDALVSGDIEKFFDQQAAVGAQAAIATGDQRLIGQFGMSALGAAAQETRRQQEAGVQELYGQKLSGPGGLTERAYGSAISAAGVQNPLAMAQVAAGSTGAEAAIETDIRALAATMGPAADVQTQAAQGQLDAAKMQLEAAGKKAQEAVTMTEMRNQELASGGLVYASKGQYINFQPKGTDTVPAMLTPGEFVVRREAVQRGNNLQILRSMNRGSDAASGATGQSSSVAMMSKGGKVRYLAQGDIASQEAGGGGGSGGGSGFGFNLESLGKFAEALTNFNAKLAENITNLANTKFEITLSPTNINVNLTGASLIKDLTDTVQTKIYDYVGQEISKYSVGNGGKLEKTGSVLGK